MSGSLDMTLDDIVKRGKTARSGERGIPHRGRGRGRGSNGFRGGGRGNGPSHRGPLAVNARPSSFSINKPAHRIRRLPWQNDLFEDGLRAAGVSGVEVETRVHITNLDQGVTNEDIRELFSEIGELKRYAIHFDKNGRPTGSAEVVYPRKSDALQAVKKYNNVLLDGKSMRLEIVGSGSAEVPFSARVNVTGLNGRLKRTVVIRQGGWRGRGRGSGRGLAPSSRRGSFLGGSQNWQGGIRGRGQGGFRGSRGRVSGGRGSGRGRGRGGRGSGKKPVEKSATELDKDLESYHATAMNTS